MEENRKKGIHVYITKTTIYNINNNIDCTPYKLTDKQKKEDCIFLFFCSSMCTNQLNREEK